MSSKAHMHSCYNQQAESTKQDADSPAELKTTELPPMEENAVPMAELPPEIVPTAVSTAEQPLRRSSRITSHLKLLNDYVLY